MGFSLQMQQLWGPTMSQQESQFSEAGLLISTTASAVQAS